MPCDGPKPSPGPRAACVPWGWGPRAGRPLAGNLLAPSSSAPAERHQVAHLDAQLPTPPACSLRPVPSSRKPLLPCHLPGLGRPTKRRPSTPPSRPVPATQLPISPSSTRPTTCQLLPLGGLGGPRARAGSGQDRDTRREAGRGLLEKEPAEDGAPEVTGSRAVLEATLPGHPHPPSASQGSPGDAGRGGSRRGVLPAASGPLPGAVHMVFPGSHTAPSNTSSAFPMARIRPRPAAGPHPQLGSLLTGRPALGCPPYPPGEAPPSSPAAFGEGSESVLRCHTSTQVSTSKS